MSVRTLIKSIQNLMRQDTGVDGDAQRISQLCWMFFLKIIDDQDQELELMQPGYVSPIPKRYQWRAWAADPEGITGEELLAFIDDDLFPALKNLRMTGPHGNRRRVRPRRVRRCPQLHEIRSVDAPGGQQDQRRRFQQPDRTPAFRRHLRADSQRPAIGGQRRRILHAPRRHRLHG